MNLPLYTFPLLAGLGLLVYLAACLRAKSKPTLPHAIKISLASLTLAGVSTIIVFPFKPLPGGTRPLIEVNLPVGATLLIGALCAGWFAADSIIQTLRAASKLRRRKGRQERPAVPQEPVSDAKS